MKLRLTIGTALLTVEALEHPGYDSISGEGQTTLDQAAYDALKGWRMAQYSRDNTESWITLHDEDDAINEDRVITNPDVFICVLTALGEIGGEYAIEWEGGCAFWVLHDVHHARNDFFADGDLREVYSPTDPIEEGQEMNAHEFALGEYVNQNGDLSLALREIMKIGEEHKERFEDNR